MRLVAVHNYYPSLSTGNYLFTARNAPIGDDLLLPWVRLYEAGLAQGVEFRTLDMVRPDERLDGCILIDIPWTRGFPRPGVPLYLVTYENEVIQPDDFNPERHKDFAKVFTWHDGFVGTHPRYVKLNFAQEFPPSIPTWEPPRRGFCAMVASPKRSDHPQELYSARQRTMQVFHGFDRASLDVWGLGWPGGKGRCESKRAVLAGYDFSICYENAKGIPGYVSEKIFDSLMVGCIPVYWGAPNITKYVPADCFIDRRLYKGDAALFDHLRSITPERKAEYRRAINQFLSSDLVKPFTIEAFTSTILANV